MLDAQAIMLVHLASPKSTSTRNPYTVSPSNLGGIGDHVSNVVSVVGAVHMGVVVIVGLIIHGGGVDSNIASALLRGGVDRIVFFASVVAEGGKGHGQGDSKGGLVVVHEADGEGERRTVRRLRHKTLRLLRIRCLLLSLSPSFASIAFAYARY